MNELGNNIKKLRETKKMSQPLLADRLGITRSAISAYENGTRLPSYTILFKLSKLFNVTVDYLIGNSVGKDYINVSGLNDEQRNLIENLIAHFAFHNELLAHSPGMVTSYKDAKVLTNDVLQTMAKNAMDVIEGLEEQED